MSEQTYLPGTEPPHHNVDIERALATWYEAKIAQKRASADTKLAHATVVLQIQHAGLEAYPWTNPDTGKKRNIVITREPKAKEANAPRGSSRRDGDAEVTPDEDREQKRARKKQREEDKVEVRRVPRSTVEDEVDPFAATRGAMASSSATTKHDKPKGKKRK